MNKESFSISLLIIAIVFIGPGAFAQETLMLRSPSVSSGHLVFAYSGDIWIADNNGKHPRILVPKQEENSSPMLSPDGKWVAFAGRYNNNTDIYIVPVSGGSPRRLTAHPGDDLPRGWDGNDRIIYASTKYASPQRYEQLFSLNIYSGYEEQLPMPQAYQGAVSADGRYIAYVKNGDVMDWSGYKLYRGGDHCAVWLYDSRSKQTTEIIATEAQNLSPVWMGRAIYFISDRDRHTRNIYRYDTQSRQTQQVTFFDDYDVKTLYSNGERLAYEQGGRIFLLDPANNSSRHIPVMLKDDQNADRPYTIKNDAGMHTMLPSPAGNKVVIEAHGDLFIGDVKSGTVSSLTATSGTHELDPCWSPDGKSLAYFSDANGEYALHIRRIDSASSATIIALNNKGFYYHPAWSPDGRKIAYCDQDKILYVVDLDSHKITRIDQDLYSLIGEPQLHVSWSPDSKWLSYHTRTGNKLNAIFLYDLQDNKKFHLTDGGGEADYPVFSKDQKFLYFILSTNYGLNVSFADMSKFDHAFTSSLYQVRLSAGIQHDDHEGTFRPIDTLDIRGRISPLPVAEGELSLLQVAADGDLLYLDHPKGSGPSELHRYNPVKKTVDTLLKAVDGYQLTANGGSIYYTVSGSSFLVPASGKITAGAGKIKMDSLTITIDPKLERQEMFTEALRAERDFFYSPGYHGVDIAKLQQKYARFLAFIKTAADLDYLFREMLGEFSVSHTFLYNTSPSPFPYENIGLLGADFTISQGHYRFKKIYGAGRWNPSVKAPLMADSVNIKPGDYLLAVNGKPADPKTNLYSLFLHTANNTVKLTVNSVPSADGAREVPVNTIDDESGLRMIYWVENNKRITDSLSRGKAGYLYLPDTNDDGYAFFNRYYFSQLDKEALVIDTRYNNGGIWPDYIINLLDRRVLSYFSRRNLPPLVEPGHLLQGPLAMVTNSSTASGGDFLAYMFKARKLGPVVGERTFGMLNGFTGVHILINGETLIIANLGAFDTSGQWIIENKGVEPDIPVTNYANDVITGHDRQLEKAVEEVQKKLTAPGPVRVPADPNSGVPASKTPR